MAFTYTGKFICHDMNDDSKRVFDTFSAAMDHARGLVGNNSYAKIFSGEASQYLFGPGNGDTSVIVRPEVLWH